MKPRSSWYILYLCHLIGMAFCCESNASLNSSIQADMQYQLCDTQECQQINRSREKTFSGFSDSAIKRMADASDSEQATKPLALSSIQSHQQETGSENNKKDNLSDPAIIAAIIGAIATIAAAYISSRRQP